jgi:hypothetical protein
MSGRIFRTGSFSVNKIEDLLVCWRWKNEEGREGVEGE